MFVESLNSYSKIEIEEIGKSEKPIRLFFNTKPDLEKLEFFKDLVLKHRNDVTLVLQSEDDDWINLNDFKSINSIKSIEFLTKCINPKFENIDGIQMFKELKEISFSYNYSNKIDLSELLSLKKIEYIYLENNLTKKQHTVINDLKSIKKLVVKNLDISLISKMPNLKYLEVYNLLNSNDLHDKIPALEKISSLDFLKGLNHIESITLDGLSNIKSIPDLKHLKKLKGFSAMNMKELKSISFFNENLERLRIGKNVPKIEIENLKTLNRKYLPKLNKTVINLKTKESSITLKKRLTE